MDPNRLWISSTTRSQTSLPRSPRSQEDLAGVGVDQVTSVQEVERELARAERPRRG